jgi:PEP-CTERM motif
MKKLLLATALASICVATTANAASFTMNGITVTQIAPENTRTFDNNPIGATSGVSSVCDAAYCGPISFATDGNVWQGLNPGISAPPAGDGTHYLWGTNGLNSFGLNGAEVVFDGTAPYSFNMYWGSIDALTTSTGSTRYDNVLTINGTASITGSDLVNFLGALGLGDQFDPRDNQWFNIAYVEPIFFFNATSSNNAFEFDMAAPEPSTWAMMALGFAGLGYAGFRRNGKSRLAIA